MEFAGSEEFIPEPLVLPLAVVALDVLREHMAKVPLAQGDDPCSVTRPNRLLTPLLTRGSPTSLALSLTTRSIEFVFYHLLLSLVDRVASLPRTTMLPEAMRLYRQNIALKAQLEALQAHLNRIENPRRPKSLSLRAAQVFALLLTRGDEQFLRYLLSAPRATVEGWLSRFRSLSGIRFATPI